MKYIDTRMFVVLIRYVQPIDVVQRHLPEHRKFVEHAYEQHIFIASGRGADGDPGVYVGYGMGREDLLEFIKNDAFYRHSVAEYEIAHFHASRACDALGVLFPFVPPPAV